MSTSAAPHTSSVADRPAATSFAPRRETAAPAATTAAAPPPKVDHAAELAFMALRLQQATLLVAMAAFCVGVLGARFAERTYIVAVFYGSFAALVASAASTVLSRLFLDQMVTHVKSANDEGTQ